MATFVFGNFLEGCLNVTAAEFEWDRAAGIRGTLIKSTWIESKEETYVSESIRASDADSGSDNTLTGSAASATTGTVSCDVSEADTTFTAIPATQTVDAICIWSYNAADASAPLIAFLEFTPIVCNGSDIKVTFGANIFTITY